MKIVRFMTTANRPTFGVWEEDRVRVIAGDPFGIWGISETCLRLEQITLILPPVDPPNIVGVGSNFRIQAAAQEEGVPKGIPVYWQSTTSVTGRDRPLIIPRGLGGSVFAEVQLALVLRKPLFQATEEESLRSLFGFTGAITLSAPIYDLEGGAEWGRGRSFDSTTAIGPFLETDSDPDQVEIVGRLNGNEFTRGNSSDFLFASGRILSEISHRHTLRAGTLVLTGPVPPSENAASPRSVVAHGDILEVEIEGLGRLSSPVVAA